MPKLKTKKTLRKRIKITGSGKIMRKKVATSHLKEKVNSSQAGRQARTQEISKSFLKSMKRMLPKVRG